MSEKFSIGEWVVLQNSTAYPEYNGWLAVVVADGRCRWSMDTRTMTYEYMFCYRVQILQQDNDNALCNGYFLCSPWQMRKLGSGERQSQSNEEHEPEAIEK